MMETRIVNFLRTMALVHGRGIERSTRPAAHRGAKRILERAARWIETKGATAILTFDTMDDGALLPLLHELASDLEDLDERDAEAAVEALSVAFTMLRDGAANHPLFDEPATIDDLSSDQLHDLDRRFLQFSTIDRGRSS